MGRPFQEKYADIKWEVDQAKFEAWKDGNTGYPIVDAVRHQLCCIIDILCIGRQCDN
jgi:deoxyribodipyrimidine photo-lyase